ncbi:MAG: hypothetical protein ACREEN_10540, partial [Stellaceae bacterium]
MPDPDAGCRFYDQPAHAHAGTAAEDLADRGDSAAPRDWHAGCLCRSGGDPRDHLGPGWLGRTRFRACLATQHGGTSMLVPSPKWLDTGTNAWQLAAATFVGLQSIPGLVVLYGGVVKKKWAINSAFMSMYAFASVLVVWVLFAYN